MDRVSGQIAVEERMETWYKTKHTVENFEDNELVQREVKEEILFKKPMDQTSHNSSNAILQNMEGEIDSRKPDPEEIIHKYQENLLKDDNLHRFIPLLAELINKKTQKQDPSSGKLLPYVPEVARLLKDLQLMGKHSASQALLESFPKGGFFSKDDGTFRKQVTDHLQKELSGVKTVSPSSIFYLYCAPVIRNRPNFHFEVEESNEYIIKTYATSISDWKQASIESAKFLAACMECCSIIHPEIQRFSGLAEINCLLPRVDIAKEEESLAKEMESLFPKYHNMIKFNYIESPKSF